MKYRKLTDINQAMTASEDAMRQADLAFLDELEKVADAIRKTAVERPVILLAGPSGSGKTTTAFLLERFLDGWGVETHTISMDNFFSTMTSQQREMAATGKLDLESPARVDIPYLNQHLQSIIACKPTWMPRYHFPTTTRIDQDCHHHPRGDDRAALCQRPHSCDKRRNRAASVQTAAHAPDAPG